MKRSRHEIDLTKEAIFNNNKMINGAPTECALEIKFQSYRKKNWQICFTNLEDQMEWQNILLGHNKKVQSNIKRSLTTDDEKR